MKKRIPFTTVPVLLVALLLPGMLIAQRGTVTIPTGNSVSVPQGASICADTIFANGPGHGTLTLAHPSGICAGAVVIPVELLSFSATMQDGVVQLTWTTATESNNLGFEVQRRTKTGNWVQLGFVEGSGTTAQPQHYTFTDVLQNVPSQTSVLRYRLKQIDVDGSYDFSPEVKVHRSTDPTRFDLAHYPSPCDEELTIRLDLGTEGASSIRLHDMSGRIVMIIAQDAPLGAGSHSLRVQTAQLPSGLYLLVVERSTARRTEKVVIRH